MLGSILKHADMQARHVSKQEGDTKAFPFSKIIATRSVEERGWSRKSPTDKYGIKTSKHEKTRGQMQDTGNAFEIKRPET